MAKKRKAARSGAEKAGPRDVDPADARIGAVSSYRDVADSEEEYFAKQDRILFDDDEPRSKRQRQLVDAHAPIEFSDEEVLGYEESEDEDDDADPEQVEEPRRRRGGEERDGADEDEDEGEGEGGDGDEERDQGWWGSSRNDYYNTDIIETEADALEEEAEAKRLQEKKLAKMAEEDFLFDEDEWRDSKPGGDGEEGVVTEVLKEVEVTDDMGTEERLQLLRARYPEFEYLAEEFTAVQPLLDVLRREAAGRPEVSLEAVKYWVLGCYVASLASYFAILTSPARDGEACKALSPSELRDHEVMETLVECRKVWNRVKDRKSKPRSEEAVEASEVPVPDEVPANGTKGEKKKAKQVEEKPEKKKKKKSRALPQDIADDLAELNELSLLGNTLAMSAPAKEDESGSEADEINTEKPSHKRSLRYYTSQLDKKARRRAAANLDAGGDTDLPYRERLKDRQARLMAEAERRGKRDSKVGAALGDPADEDDEENGDDDGGSGGGDGDAEYYDMVASAARKKKDTKAERFAALAEAGRRDRVVEVEEVGEDGKRRITYEIQRNRGMAPRKKKENKNPRVKKRRQFEKRMQKMKSMRGSVKKEGIRGYEGEKTGINPRVIRSVPLTT